MDRLKRYAAAILACGFLLAMATPACLIISAPGTRVYLGHPVIFLMQALPYVLCAALWLPARLHGAGRIAVTLSLLLLVAACVLYLPMLTHPERSGSDMIALGFALICAITTGSLLALSLLAFAVARWFPGHPRA